MPSFEERKQKLILKENMTTPIRKLKLPPVVEEEWTQKSFANLEEVRRRMEKDGDRESTRSQRGAQSGRKWKTKITTRLERASGLREGDKVAARGIVSVMGVEEEENEEEKQCLPSRVRVTPSQHSLGIQMTDLAKLSKRKWEEKCMRLQRQQDRNQGEKDVFGH